MIALMKLMAWRVRNVWVTWLLIGWAVSLAFALLPGMARMWRHLPEMMCVVFPVLVFARGKQGEGKFLARIPLARWQIFLSLYGFGIVGMAMFFLVFWLGMGALRWIMVVSGVPLGEMGLTDAGLLLPMIGPMLATYSLLVMLVSLVRSLERAMSPEHARNLATLVLLIVVIAVPMILSAISHDPEGARQVEHQVRLTLDWLFPWLKAWVMTLLGFIGGMALFRVRRFQSF